jgi:Transposase DDE domain/Insertion element 4 transposase N-terminal
LCAHFAMLVPVPSAVPAGHGGSPEPGSEALAARVAAGPGLWDDEDWLAELRRNGLIGDLLAAGVIGQAAAEGGHGHRAERALTAEMTLLSLVTSALFPGQGYDMVLARSFSMPGVRVRPGTPVPTGPAFSQGRARLGERPMRRAFELDAARGDVPLAAGGTAFGLELVIFDGTTLDLFNCPELAAEFGVPEGGKHPKLRVVALLQAGTMRWKAAAVGGYHDGENTLADQLEGALRPGQLSLADRGFFSMDRWLRFSAAGAHLLWRVKNAARSVPFRQLRTLKDGSELVLLRESANMLGKRRRDAGDRTVPRLEDTVARLVCFTVLTRTSRGRTKTAAIRVLTTLLDPDAFPAAEIAALYAARWQVETAFLHLKRTVRGAGRELRGRSAALARQEAWALLLVHNMIAAMAARAAVAAGTGLAAVSFTAVLSLVRDHTAADTCCRHCGKRPTSGGDPLAQLTAAIADQPLNRRDRKRTSGRTTAERSKWPTEEATYDLTIVPSNLPKADISPGT